MAAPHITVVDDDASVRESMSSLLRSVGHVVNEFGSAEEMLASAALDETDCLITDVRMPGMSGWNCSAVLRSAIHGCRSS
jgi:FixJ family two-component response regulator